MHPGAGHPPEHAHPTRGFPDRNPGPFREAEGQGTVCHLRRAQNEHDQDQTGYQSSTLPTNIDRQRVLCGYHSFTLPTNMDPQRGLLGEHHSSILLINMDPQCALLMEYHSFTLPTNMGTQRVLLMESNADPQPALLGADLFGIREQRQRHSG
jgi:hypothetical protein